MSTSAQQIPPLISSVERRFYPRIVPQAPIFVAFSESGSEESLLLNVSENGLLVSTPADLACNFVARLCVRLHGLPKPVQVTARVVWSSETNKLAGVQLLNLNEYDRQQIRKWGARESAQSLPSEPDQPLLVVPPSASSSEASYAAAGPTDEAFLGASGEIVAPTPPPIANKRFISAVAGRAIRAMLMATVCLAATILLIKAAPGNPFARLKNTRSLPSATTSLDQEIQLTSQPLGISNHAATQAAAPSSPDNPTASKLGPITATSPHHDSAKIVKASSAAGREENPAAAQSDLSLTAALPATAEVAAERSNVSSQSSAVAEIPSEVMLETEALPSTDRATLLQPLSIPTRPANLPASTSATISSNTPSSTSSMPPSNPIAAPTRAAFAPQPALTVIQMDPPRNQVLEVRLPSARQASFLPLPGERVLETPSVTMHIQRSVLMPASHGGWFASRNKKVVVGELISRVDPQAVQISTVSANSVRVKATIAADGHIENVKQILGPPNLIPSVAKALREWRYQPTLVDNKPVETQCYVVFQFHAATYRSAKR
jgi:PilZ domain/Gram-negative bacterial TonB protein C-terminal